MSKPEPVYNIFEALNLPNAEELTARANLAAKIIGIVQERGLSHQAAAKIIGCAPARIKMVCNAELDDFTMDELCRFLVALGQNVEIAVNPAAASDAHISVA